MGGAQSQSVGGEADEVPDGGTQCMSEGEQRFQSASVSQAQDESQKGEGATAGGEKAAAAAPPPQEPSTNESSSNSANNNNNNSNSNNINSSDTSSNNSNNNSNASLPSASDILAELIALLGRSPSQSLPVAEIRDRLPPALRKMAEDTSNIRLWLSKFQGLFQISGPPGEEVVILTIGMMPPRASAGSESSDGITGGKPTNDTSSVNGSSVSDQQRRVNASPSPAPSPKLEEGQGKKEEQHQHGGAGDEEESNPALLQLRGLPFRATMADIKAFLGEHVAGLAKEEQAIRLLLNRDGRPSGFAKVQFSSPQAATACREALHRKRMGDRYVEVMPCPERSSRQKARRAGLDAAAGGGEGGDADESALDDAAERERLVDECRTHMQSPDRNKILLSMLGIALSDASRAYLRRSQLGLKNILQRFPAEFRVEGPKGCESVIYCGPGSTIDMNNYMIESMMPWGMTDPETPQQDAYHNHLVPESGGAGPHGLSTPSVWGTPGQLGGGAPAGATAGPMPPMDPMMEAYNHWFMQTGVPPWAWTDPAFMAAAAASTATAGSAPSSTTAVSTAGGGATKGAKETAKADTKAKRSGKSEAAPTRSHAHLHPQSHPFANRPAADGSGTVVDERSKEPCLRLRGLPFNLSVQDVLAFFSQHNVADRITDGPKAAELLSKANGRPSGQAVVLMRSAADAHYARSQLNKQSINGRYIEVFAYGGDEDLPQDEESEETAQAGKDGVAEDVQHALAAAAPGFLPGADAMAMHAFQGGMPSFPWGAPPPPPTPGGFSMPDWVTNVWPSLPPPAWQMNTEGATA